MPFSSSCGFPLNCSFKEPLRSAILPGFPVHPGRNGPCDPVWPAAPVLMDAESNLFGLRKLLTQDVSACQCLRLVPRLVL